MKVDIKEKWSFAVAKILGFCCLLIVTLRSLSSYTHIIRYWGTKVQLYIRAGSTRGTKCPLIILLRSSKHAVLNYAFY